MFIERFDHLVLTVNNINKTIDFYQKVLGMEVITFDKNRYALKFGQQKINLHEKENNLMIPKAKHPLMGSEDFCLIADCTIDEVISCIEKHSIEIELGPVEQFGALGKMLSIYIRDPDENLVEIATYIH